MKISFVSQDLRNYGGLEKWHIQIANLLASRGHDVSVLGIDLGEVKRVDVAYFRDSIRFQYLENVSLKSLDKIESDVVYTAIGNRSVLDHIINLKAATIFGAHHSEYVLYHSERGIAWSKNFFSAKSFKTKLWILRLIRILPKFDAIHLITPILSDWKKYNPNIFVLNNTSLSPISKATKRDTFTVLFLGRHEKIKGVETVIKVAQNLPNDTELLIAGYGSLSDELKRLVNERVKFLGFLDDEQLADTIASSHLVLFPSYSENNSAITNEALQNGTPVLARDSDFNLFLKNKPLCHFAGSDNEFIRKVGEQRDIYYRDPKAYNKKCEELKEGNTSLSDYVTQFEKMLATCKDLAKN